MSNAQEDGKTPTPTAEEIKQEQEALIETTEDEVRAEVVSRFGLNDNEKSELVNKLVAHELEQRKTLGKAIGQKVKLREQLEAKPTGGDDKKDDTPPTTPATPADGGKNQGQPVLSFAEQMREFKAVQDFDEKQLSYIERLSKADDISISEAAKSDDFQFWNESYKRKVEEEKTTPNPSSKQPSGGNSDVATLTLKDVQALPPLDPRREEWNKLQTDKHRGV